jgi:hypothetical protein
MPVSEILRTPLYPVDKSGKYYKFQIKGWVNFDPTGKALGEIAKGIEEEGEGFLTLVDVVKVEDDVAKIGDEEAREYFENILAARRVLRNVEDLPRKLAEELRSAMNIEAGVTTERKVVPIASSPAHDSAG